MRRKRNRMTMHERARYNAPSARRKRSQDLAGIAITIGTTAIVLAMLALALRMDGLI